MLKRSKMREAFDLLKSPNLNAITHENFSSLLKLLDPEKFKNEKQIEILFEVIDFDSNNSLGNIKM